MGTTNAAEVYDDPSAMVVPPRYAHQQETVDYIKPRESVFITSSPGTGKTRSVLDAFDEDPDPHKRALVLAPLSILQVAWGNDCEAYTPNRAYQCAYAKNRKEAFDLAHHYDMMLTNHDAVKWLIKKENVPYLKQFTWLIIDESTAYKNPNSQRSKAVDKVKLLMDPDKIILMTGTPNNNTIMDIWNQIHILDGGARLGNYYSFRMQACKPVQLHGSPVTLWRDKPGIEDEVADLIKDINIRHKFEDCISIPPNHTSTLYTKLSPRLTKLYAALKKEALLELKDTTVTAVHAGVLANKLLQLSSGAVYDSEKVKQVLDHERYDLIIELVKERDHSVVFFNWQHQKEELILKATKEKIPYAIIDGSVSAPNRIKAVDDFQAGKLQMLLCHPQAAGHGITLTKGTATIWASPTYNAEHYVQANQRIYRSGQKNRTETIRICAKDTLEEQVFEKLEGKLERMTSLLDLLNNLKQGANHGKT
jgi:SNF2 family DNA or RNA helicase